MRPQTAIFTKMLFGGLIAIALPREGILEGSTRIIPFVALLMAGVLPAMMQTVTVLKGDDLSPKAVHEYGAALKEQLNFWAAIFGSALTTVALLVFAVIISKSNRLISMPFNYYLDRNFVVDIFLFLFGCTASSVIGRFVSAYGGLKSLLGLNLHLAEKKSLKNAAKAAEGLTKPVIEPSVRQP